MRKSLNLLICALLLVAFVLLPNFSSTAKAATSELELELQAMAQLGVVKGDGNGNLRPKDNVRRGEFAMFITRALNLPKGPENVFTDVPSSAALAAGINSAYAAKLVFGKTKTTFEPDENITRQEAAAIIARALINYKGITSKQPPAVFSDDAQISKGLKSQVYLNAEYQIIKGIANSNGTYRFLPQEKATREAAAAFIARMLRVSEGPGQSLYTINTIENSTYKPTNLTFESLESAKAAITANNQVILHQNKVVYMTNGFAYPNKAITLYLSSDFSRNDHNFSYAPNQEMKFLDTTSEYVKVQVANTIAYAKPSEVTLVPLPLLKDRNYYTVNDAGEVLHYIYNPTKLKHEAPYVVGKAPSFMQKGVNYYSWNGSDFTTTTGATVGTTVYQYFNVLAARSKTSYTAEELNSFINKRLAELEASGDSYFKDATKKSKIIGFGDKVKAAEAKYGINGLMILSMAIHESKFGMDPINALVKNNLFGLNALDGTNDAKSFATVDEGIDELVNQYLNKNYIEPGSAYFHGAVLGNKSTGFNVKYASDPYWGQKIAGHMYKVDKALGSKDFNNYRIFETNQASVKVRSTPGTFAGATTVIITYKNSGVPVTVKGSTNHQENGQTWEWFEIIPDTIADTTGYSRSDVITELTIVK
jgi:beta-N-acetylglucosaminidase